jgi:5-(carboxyamino)imidazole ribonucleotide synthase
VQQTIGIIGGGQLGRYLCRSARALGFRTIVMTAEPEPPAASDADRILPGAADDLEMTETLLREADIVTFEIEAVGPAVLERLAAADAAGTVSVRPGAGVLAILRNKASQKRWVAAQGLPTAPFRVFDDAHAALTPATLAGFDLPLVQKAQVGGYDGRGVHILRSAADLERLLPGPCLVEDFVEHVAELAILVARGGDGEVRCYDPVALRFEPDHHILDQVLAPAVLAPALADRCRSLACATVQALGGVGVFALELFLTPADEIIINEISPRVHNAGHLSLEACRTSQFEQHIRAVAGLALGSTELERPAAMRNLLWRGVVAPAQRLPPTLPGNSARIHWYDKTEGRPWRKMGHLTALGDSAAAAAAEAERACQAILTLTNGACG